MFIMMREHVTQYHFVAHLCVFNSLNYTLLWLYGTDESDLSGFGNTDLLGGWSWFVSFHGIFILAIKNNLNKSNKKQQKMKINHAY